MTLFTSDIDINSKRAARTSFIYLLVSLFLILFGAVYEVFSHGVYSYFMIYAFAFPLVGGTLPFTVIQRLHKAKFPTDRALFLYNAGIATLTVGSIIRGVLDIYGTTNSLTSYYWFIGIALVLTGIISYIAQIFSQNGK